MRSHPEARMHRCLLLVFLTLMTTTLSAAVFEMPSDRAMVEQADLIVIATPMQSVVDPSENGVVSTITTMRVEKRLTGQSAPIIQVRERGGRIGDRIVAIPGTPRFKEGERVLLFLRQDRDGRYHTWSMALGKFDFVEHGAETVLVRGLDEGRLCTLSRDGEMRHDTVRTTRFIDWIVDVAAHGQSPITYETTIDHGLLLEKLTDGPTPSSSHRAAYLLVVAGRPVRWKTFDTNGSLQFHISGTQSGVDGIGGSQAAAAAWSSSGSDVSISINPSCSVCERVVTDNSEMAIILGGDPADLPTGDQAAAATQYIAIDAPYTLDGETFNPLDHADVFVSTNMSGGQTFFEALLTHELGHAIGIRHSNQGTPSSTDAIMNSFIPSSGANLRVWDLDAVQTVYGEGPDCRLVDITAESSNMTLAFGQGTTLSVTVSSLSTTPSYQWYKSSSNDFANATAIPGASSRFYDTGPLQAGTYYFWAKVTNDCSSETTNAIQITVHPCIGASIVTQPVDAQVTAGNAASLKVTGDGSSPLSYQWYRGERGTRSTPIFGATNPIYNTGALNATSKYWVEVSNSCGSEESRTVTVTVTGGCVLPSITVHPKSQTVIEGAQLTLNVTASSPNGPITYQWFRIVDDAPIPVGTSSATYVTDPITEDSRYFVEVTDSCGTVPSQVAEITVLGCQIPGIGSLSPNERIRWGASASLMVEATGDGPFTYQWYQGTSGSGSAISGATGATYETGPLTEKTFYWVRVANDCGSADSTTVVIEPVCLPPDPASIGVVPVEPLSGTPYIVSWSQQPGVTSHRLEESTSADFTSATAFEVAGHSRTFVKSVTEATRFHYRVRGVADCDGSIGVYSPSISVAIVPPPAPDSPTFDVVVSEGSSMPITLQVFVAGTGVDIPFTIETTIPWLTVTPSSGVLPAAGMHFTVVADVSQMQLGSNTGTFTVQLGSSGKDASNGGTMTTSVTVSLVTPVTTEKKTTPSEESLIILGVAHASGFNSQWQSDVRLLNIGTGPADMLVKYIPAGPSGFQNVKGTEFSLNPGVSTALNDVVKNVYGVGSTGESEIGSLEIGRSGTGSVATIASSRTFNKSQSGTFGQFIPPIPFSRFIGLGEPGGPKPRLSMQQISQSSAFRTNVAILEAAGATTQVAVSVFDTSGNRIREIPYTLAPGELKTLNGLLAANGITLDDGRLEVTVSSGNGRIHAYASVVDNRTNDPFLVPAVDLSSVSATRWILPGMADLQTGQASWRSDVRILNAGDTTIRPMLTFYPQGTGNPTSVSITIAPGQVAVLNDLLRQTFDRESTGGALHITTDTPAKLVATARTYDRQATGTYGQFIPAVTPADAFSMDSRPTYVLQLEESPFFRSNLGLTEVTGNPVLLRVTATVPGQKISPSAQVGVNGFGFTQLNRILSSMGLDGSFNGRISVEVVNGTGKIVAYGSIIDNTTQDPTYVPGQ